MSERNAAQGSQASGGDSVPNNILSAIMTTQNCDGKKISRNYKDTAAPQSIITLLRGNSKEAHLQNFK